MFGFPYTYTLPDGTKQVGRFGEQGLRAAVAFRSGDTWKVWSAYRSRSDAVAGKHSVSWKPGDDAQVIEITEGGAA